MRFSQQQHKWENALVPAMVAASPQGRNPTFGSIVFLSKVKFVVIQPLLVTLVLNFVFARRAVVGARPALKARHRHLEADQVHKTALFQPPGQEAESIKQSARRWTSFVQKTMDPRGPTQIGTTQANTPSSMGGTRNPTRHSTTPRTRPVYPPLLPPTSLD